MEVSICMSVPLLYALGMEQDKSHPKLTLGEKIRLRTAESLYSLLANTYALYLKTQNFHWNVTGGEFTVLHRLFQKQYEELAAASDEIAERIRVLGFFVAGSLTAFAESAEVKIPANPPAAAAMVAQLAADNEALAELARGIWRTASDNGDSGTEALAGGRVAEHEKMAWMLRALAA